MVIDMKAPWRCLVWQFHFHRKDADPASMDNKFHGYFVSSFNRRTLSSKLHSKTEGFESTSHFLLYLRIFSQKSLFLFLSQ